MSILFLCPSCLAKLGYAESGVVVECPQCESKVRVPEAPEVLDGIPLPAEEDHPVRYEPQTPARIYPPPRRRKSGPLVVLGFRVGLALALLVASGAIVYVGLKILREGAGLRFFGKVRGKNRRNTNQSILKPFSPSKNSVRNPAGL